MRKLLGYTGAALLFLSLLPTAASAELRCYNSADNSVSVQTANSCYGPNGYAPGTAGYLLDTSTGTWTNWQGQTVSGYGASPITCDSSSPGATYVPNTLNGGGTWMCPNGATTNGTTGQSTPPTQTTSSSGSSPAQGGGKLSYTPLEPLPNGTSESYNSLSAYLTLMFNILLSIGAMFAVVTLVLGGITYIVSEVVDKKEAARRRIRASFVGLAILLTCWIILYTINPNLLKLCIFQLDAQCGGASSGSASGTAGPAPATINTAEVRAQEAACKSGPGGDQCAFNPVPGKPGSFECYCGV